MTQHLKNLGEVFNLIYIVREWL